MRTTVNLDEDIIDVARSMSLARGISLGSALSILARRGIRRSGGDTEGVEEDIDRFPTFSVTESVPSFSTEDVRRALDED
ncbi:MAG TPA: hypothetical protein VJ932_11885 [Alkalispirochaeta sp.]|nr:hypothetical protein [Alkalispirochaeta sp.]